MATIFCLSKMVTREGVSQEMMFIGLFFRPELVIFDLLCC